jgi:hypothetical protein
MFPTFTELHTRHKQQPLFFFEQTVKAYAFPNFYKKKRVDPVYKENRTQKPYNSGRRTAQLGEQRTPNDSGPQTIQPSTMVGWIGTSTRTAQLNNSSVGLGHRHDQLKQLQRIGPVGLGHRSGSPQLCSAVDASHQTLPRNKTSLLPSQRDSTDYSFFATKKRKNRENKRRKHSQIATNTEAPGRRINAAVSHAEEAQCHL